MADKMFPILGKAETLSQVVVYRGGGSRLEEIRTFEDARERLIPQFETLLDEAAKLPNDKRIRSGVYFSIDLDSKYLAKSYFPKTYFDKSGLELTGSVGIRQVERDGKVFETPKQARRLYFKSSLDSIEKTYRALVKNEFKTKEELAGPIRIDKVFFPDNSTKQIGIQNFKDGILELIVHPMPDNDWDEFQDILFGVLEHDNYPTLLFKWIMGGQANVPRFVPIQTNLSQLNELISFNPVRAIRKMPAISYPRISTAGIVKALQPPSSDPIRSGNLPSVGVFDGGVDTTIPHLGKWVIPFDLTGEPVDANYLQHGTAVCGAVLYGDRPDVKCSEPAFRVKSFRVFPTSNDTGIPELDLYHIVELISETVKSKSNNEIKAYVLSFGPWKPVEDNEIDLFTSTLDRLAFEHDVLFVVAAGNDGELADPLNRIQPPADSVNGIGVGAYIFDDEGNPTKAPYSCLGPGRNGNAIKPDIHMFGGGLGQPFCVFEAGGMGDCTHSMGTSFAAPLACSMAGHLLYRAEDPSILTPQTAKALLIHRAYKEGWDPSWGWGPLTCNVDDLMQCTQNNVTLIYNGTMPLNKRTLLRVPYYLNDNETGKVRFSWTLVFATDVAPSMPDEYVLGGADVTFRPNSNVFTYTYDNKSKTINKQKYPLEYRRLIKNKVIRPDKLPATLSPVSRYRYLTEDERRAAGVWDTSRHFWTNWKYFSSIHDPVIDIHAQARSDWYYDFSRPSHLTYSCVVSIELNKQKIDLYQRIKDKLPNLIEVRLRSRARARV